MDVKVLCAVVRSHGRQKYTGNEVTQSGSVVADVLSDSSRGVVSAYRVECFLHVKAYQVEFAKFPGGRVDSCLHQSKVIGSHPFGSICSLVAVVSVSTSRLKEPSEPAPDQLFEDFASGALDTQRPHLQWVCDVIPFRNKYKPALPEEDLSPAKLFIAYLEEDAASEGPKWSIGFMRKVVDTRSFSVGEASERLGKFRVAELSVPLR